MLKLEAKTYTQRYTHTIHNFSQKTSRPKPREGSTELQKLSGWGRERLIDWLRDHYKGGVSPECMEGNFRRQFHHDGLHCVNLFVTISYNSNNNKTGSSNHQLFSTNLCNHPVSFILSFTSINFPFQCSRDLRVPPLSQIPNIQFSIYCFVFNQNLRKWNNNYTQSFQVCRDSSNVSILLKSTSKMLEYELQISWNLGIRGLWALRICWNSTTHTCTISVHHASSAS